MLPCRLVDFLSAYENQPTVVGHPPDWPTSTLQFAQQLMNLPGRPVEMQLDDDHRIGKPS
jgi:hypothetical protein